MTWLRWTIIAAMLLIALAWPGSGRTGQQLWVLALGFAGYNLIVELLRHRIPRLETYAWVPYTDLPVTGLICAFGTDSGGPLFVGFFIAVLTAANYLSPRSTALYVAVVILTIVVIVPTLPTWSPTSDNLRHLAARLVVLTTLGFGTALLSRRLARHARITGELRRKAERLDELDRLRSDFIASVSHDLLTPLTSMQAGLGMIATSGNERLLPDERRLIDNARRSVERLALLVDDLLLVNKIRTRTLDLVRSPIDLRDAVTDATSVVSPLLSRSSQTVDTELTVPLPVDGDRRRLGQVIVNLLANAHTHTPPGTKIAIDGRIEGGEILLTVSDDGPGIPDPDRETVFGRYARLSSTAGGSGLGLSDARLLVELHGGRLWLESPPGVGASFRMALPLARRGTAE